MFRLKNINHMRSEKGDTIVEVILVLAVLSLALSISYATANNDLVDIRQAQDNSTATQYVTSQIEGLRVEADNPNIYVSQGFCLTPNNNVASGTFFNVTDASNPAPSQCSLPAPFVNGTLYDYFCGGQVPTGETAPASVNALCTSNQVSNTADTFIVFASWTDPNNINLTDTITQVYRVHP
jgi:type II secretory pathway pseudopilin PulG